MKKYKVELTEKELEALIYHSSCDHETCEMAHSWEDLELGHTSDQAWSGIKKLENALRNNGVCPKCSNYLRKEETSSGYFGNCLKCDEDFYKFEVYFVKK